jgi:hypothetical protein
MKQFFGGILLAVGILIAGASGLCSLWVLFMPGGEFGGDLSILPLVLLIGGIPFALGTAIAFGGRSLIRQARKEREQSDGEVSKIFE